MDLARSADWRDRLGLDRRWHVTPLELLRRVHWRFRVPSRYSQDGACYDADGYEVNWRSRQAVRWSLFGALLLAEPDDHATRGAAHRAILGNSRKHNGGAIVALNLRSTHTEILARLDAAIARLEAAA